MLTFTEVVWVDVAPYLLSREQPIVMLPRSKPDHKKPWAGTTQLAHMGEFWVPQGQVLGEEIAWSMTKTEEVVRVPVFAYKVDRALSSVFGLGIQIGMAALADLRQYTKLVPQSVTLVLGTECTDLMPAENSFRCYVGIAIRTQ